MHKGIIQSALTSRRSLELEYREPSTNDSDVAMQAMDLHQFSEEFICVLRTLYPGLENLQ